MESTNVRYTQQKHEEESTHADKTLCKLFVSTPDITVYTGYFSLEFSRIISTKLSRDLDLRSGNTPQLHPLKSRLILGNSLLLLRPKVLQPGPEQVEKVAPGD